jgi:hypothetical protein
LLISCNVSASPSCRWPRFKSIFDDNVASVMRVPYADVKLPSRPHAIGLRYAQFASGILTLNEGYDDDILVANLKRLRGEVDKFLNRTADRLAAKTRLVFLLNNYHAILHILTTHRHLSSEDYKYWTEVASSQTSQLVEVELEETFPQLVKMLRAAREAEAQARREGRSGAQVVFTPGQCDYPTYKSVVQRFEKDWKSGIERFHASIQKNFLQPDVDTSSGGSSGSAAAASGAGKAAGGQRVQGTAASSKVHVNDIFMRTLSQLMLYCETMGKLQKEYFDSQPDRRQVSELLVPPRLITIEAKKYTQA